MGYALSLVTHPPAKLPELCTKLHVKLMVAIAFILGIPSDTSKNKFRSI
jgi:hypothetical protein